MLHDMLTAFRTLTIIPIPGKDTEIFSRSLCFFPLVGALLGFVVLILYHSAGAIGFKHPFILALLSMAIVTWLTGGLHIDGLGDVADAFGGGKAKERKNKGMFQSQKPGTVVQDEDGEPEQSAYEREEAQGSRKIFCVSPRHGNNGQSTKGC